MKKRKFKLKRKIIGIVLVAILIVQLTPLNLFAQTQEGVGTNDGTEITEPVANEPSASPEVTQPETTPEEAPVVTPETSTLFPPQQSVFQGITPAAASDLSLTLWDGTTQVADLSDPDNDYTWAFNKVLTLKATLNFPNATDTDKKLEIYLNEDMEYVTFPTMASLPAELVGAITSQTRTNQTKILDDTVTLPNGTLTYTIDKGSTGVELQFNIKPNKYMRTGEALATITNAVEGKVYYGGGLKESNVLETIKMIKGPGKTPVFSLPSKSVVGDYFNGQIAMNRMDSILGATFEYVEYAKYEIVYPEGVEVGVLPANSAKFIYTHDPLTRTVSYEIKNTLIIGDPNEAGAYGRIPFKVSDDRTDLVGETLTYTANFYRKGYNAEPVVFNNIVRTQLVEAAQPENLSLVEGGSSVLNQTFNKENLNQALSGFTIQNLGNAATVEKKLAYTFSNPEISISGVAVPAPEQLKTDYVVKYKLVGDPTEYTYSGVVPTMINYNFVSSRIFTNKLIGKPNAYFSSIVFENVGSYNAGYSRKGTDALNNSTSLFGKFNTAMSGNFTVGAVSVSDAADGNNVQTVPLTGNVLDPSTPNYSNFRWSELLGTPTVFAGDTKTTPVVIYTDSFMSAPGSILKNPEFYFLEKDGLTFSNFIFRDETGKVLDYTITTNMVEGNVVKIIKFNNEEVVGLYNKNFGERTIYGSIDITTLNTTPSSVFDLSNYAFAGSKNPLSSLGAVRGRQQVDSLDLDGDGDSEEIILGMGETLTITAQKKVVLSNGIKLNTSGWNVDNSKNITAAFNAGATADYRFNVYNASGISVDGFKAYIPVPKTGQNFGTDFQTEPFKWNMALDGAIDANDTGGIYDNYTITYSTNAGAPTDGTDPTGTFVPAGSITDWKAVTMIKLENKPGVQIPTDTNLNFDFQYLIDENEETTKLKSGQSNVFRPHVYRNYGTTNGFVPGQSVTATLVTGEIGGRAFTDVNRDGKQDPGDTALAGVTVKITKEDGSVIPGYTPASITTDPEGKYSFPNLTPGNYKVTVVNPGQADSALANPLKFTLTKTGSDVTIDSDMTPNGTQTEGTSIITVPNAAAVNTDVGFIKPYTITLKSDVNGTLVGGNTTINRWEGETIGSGKLPGTTPDTNYRLEGWVKDTDTVAQTTAAAEAIPVAKKDVTYTARFIGVDQTVTFDSQGGIFASEVGTPTTISKVTPFDKTFTFPSAPTKSHYVFAGWYKDPGCTAGQEALDSTYKTPLGGATLYAKWMPKALQPEFNFIQASPMTKTYGDPNFTVNAGGGAGTGAVTYELVSGPGTINPTTGEVTITGAGPIVVKATKAEDATNDTAEATLTINVAKATLTATTTNQTSVYGEALPALPSVAVTGFVLGETASMAPGYTAPTVSYTGGITPVNAGNYGYTISGGLATNYSFNYDTTKALTVTKAVQPELIFTDASVTKTYGDADFTNTLSGGAGTGAVTYSSSDTTKATIDATGKVTIKGAGNVTITATKAGDSNYSNTVTKTYTLTINKKDLTATADTQTKVYLEANPTLTISYTGFATGDDVSKLTGTKPTASTTAVASSPVGTYPITVTVTAATDTNYNFVKGTDATLTVTKGIQPELAFASASVTKTYGDATFTNAISGGAGTGALTFESSNPAVAEIDAATGLVTIKGAGNATITATKLGDNNYSNTVTKTYEITVDKKELTVTPDSKVKVYGEANEALTMSYTGFVNGEGEANLTGTLPTISTTATDSSNAGSYPITVDVASATDANYTFAKGTDATYTISKKNQDAITFEDATVEKTYGDITFEDVLTSIGSGTGQLTYTSSDESKATVDQNGQVTIKGAGDVTITAKKAADGNYTSDVTASFALTINKATLTATASNETMVAGQSLPTGNVTVTGFKYADTAKAAKGYETPKVAYTTNGATAGTYTINVNGGKADDYTFAYTAGTLTVNPAPVPPVDPVKPVTPVTPGKKGVSIEDLGGNSGSKNGALVAKETTKKDKDKDKKTSEKTTPVDTKEGNKVTETNKLPSLAGLLFAGAMSLIFVIGSIRKKQEKENLKKAQNIKGGLGKTVIIIGLVLAVSAIMVINYLNALGNPTDANLALKSNVMMISGNVILAITYISTYIGLNKDIEKLNMTIKK